MAWRIGEQLIRGEIDNRVRGRVTGRLWFVGLADPIVLDLEGDAAPDIAGHLVRFTNPAPEAGPPGAWDGLERVQRGRAGDISASRKVKVPDCPMDEVLRLVRAGKRFPWHWGNSLHLEWHGEKNGRVVIEGANFRTEVDPGATPGVGAGDVIPREFMDDDAPTSAAEAEADAEQARMDLLLDRVEARLRRARDAGEKEPDFETIMEEERARLRRERGEPEPEPPSPEEEAERAEWIAEMNAAAEEALREQETEKWKASEQGFPDDRWHPLVERCNALTHRLRGETRARGWLGDEDGREHPLREVIDGVMIAGGKLAGALGTRDDEADWPPDPLVAGTTLTRLKKARGHLRDALAGLDAADEQDLAEAEWRRAVREEAREILAEVVRLIAEVRAVLRLSEEGGRAE